MQTYPNQKVVVIHSMPHKKDGPEYGCLDRKAGRTATAVLLRKSGATLAIYFDLALNQNAHTRALSPVYYKEMGISEKQYRAAIKNLIRAGYIVRRNPDSNLYDFYELPPQYVNYISQADIPKHTAPEIDADNLDTIPLEQVEPEETVDQEHLPPQRETQATETSLPTGLYTPPGGELSIPSEGDDLSLQGNTMHPSRGREIIHDNTYNTRNNTNAELSPGDEDSASIVDDVDSLESKIKATENKILDGYGWEVYLTAINKADSRQHLKSRNPQEYLKRLGVLMGTLNTERTARTDTARAEYLRMIEKTMPDDSIEHTKVGLILDRYCSTAQLKHYREKYGIWLNGWDEERQEPNVILGFPGFTPSISKMCHNIDGIPKEYYMAKPPATN